MALRFTYFDGRGRGEFARLLLAEANIRYEDIRVTHQETWPQLKPLTPYGQLPILDIGDVRIAQSAAIDMYIARIGNLYGKTPLEAARMDMIMEGLKDLAENFFKTQSANADEKKAKVGDFVNTEFPKQATIFTNLLKQNAEGKGYFVGDNVSVADIAFFRVMEILEAGQPDILKDAPLLKALADRVAARPNIAAYLKARPPSPW